MQTKMIAIPVGLWFQAVPKGSADMEMWGLC